MTKNYIINNRFIFYKDLLLGDGGFGYVYIGKDLKYNKYVAIKCESNESKKKKLLEHEYKLMRNLKNTNSFPIPIWYGQDNNYNFLIMKKYGKNLEVIRKYCGNTFTDKTLSMLGIEMINKLKILHENNIIHRDIKPENFLIDKATNNIQLIDFGLSKFYIDNNTKLHISMEEDVGRSGTIRYMSINSHEKITLSRRDDFISLSYMLIYLSKGILPWQGIISSNNQHHKVRDIKIETYLNGKLLDNINKALYHLITYSISLKFNEKPDYDYLIKLFKNYCYDENINIDYKWDWIK